MPPQAVRPSCRRGRMPEELPERLPGPASGKRQGVAGLSPAELGAFVVSGRDAFPALHGSQGGV